VNTDVSAHCFAARALGAALLALLCAGCGDPAQENRDRLYARAEELSQIPPREQLTAQPYIKGRALVVSKKQDPPGMLIEDPIVWGSDEAKELMAESPEQVETVVVLNFSKEAAATYQVEGGTGSLYGHREVCEVILIDRSIPAVTHRKTFRGPDLPPRKVVREGQPEVLSPVDLTTVRNYVMRLPRR
jgi:hypothetical protein